MGLTEIILMVILGIAFFAVMIYAIKIAFSSKAKKVYINLINKIIIKIER